VCGIIGIHFKDPENPGIERMDLEFLVDELLLGIEHRGKDATGLLAVPVEGEPQLVKADVPATRFVQWRETMPAKLRTILGHTRFATQGKPEDLDNDHPVVYETCFAIHNGHISNDTELFAEHSLERRAEVDSEIIPALFNKYGLDKAHLALQELEGGFATAVVNPTHFPGVTVLAKGWSSPCEVLETKGAIIWASTKDAIQMAAKEVLGFSPAADTIKSMSEGQILYMENDKIELMEFKPKAKVFKPRSNSTYVYNGGSTYYYNSAKGDRDCDSCGCKALWHGKPGSYSGPCEKTINGFRCRCIDFVEQKQDVLGMEFCDGCGREFFIGDMVKIDNKYLCPRLCAKDPEFNGRAASPASVLRNAAEAVVAAHVAFAKANNQSEFDDPAWAVRMNSLHTQTCLLVAKETGQSPNFINWLIFEMKPELAENDGSGWLKESWKLADETYGKWREKLDDEVSEIENQRWLAGDVNLGNACNTESDKCSDPECGVDAICDDCEVELCSVEVINLDEYREEVTA
jgi:hypothetical protein